MPGCCLSCWAVVVAMAQWGSGRGRKPERSLSRDPEIAQASKNERKKYTRGEKRKRDDEPKTDDEQTWGPWTGEGLTREDGDKPDIIELWFWKENDSGQELQTMYKHDLTLDPLSPQQIRKYQPDSPQEPQIYSSQYVDHDSRCGLDQPHAMEATAKAGGKKPRGMEGVSSENGGTNMHGVAAFASGATSSYIPPPPPPNTRPPNATGPKGSVAWNMQKASSPAVARSAATSCAAAFPPGPGGYNRPNKKAQPRTPDEAPTSGVSVKQEQGEDKEAVWSKRLAHSSALAQRHRDCDHLLIEDPEDPEDLQCELVWLRLVSLQQAVTTAMH